MKIFLFDDNRVYCGTENAYIQPQTGKLLVPANGLLEEVPLTGKNECAVAVGKRWVVTANYVGTEYWPADSSHDDDPIKITEAGISPPEGALFERPPKSLPQRKQELEQEVMTFYATIREAIKPSELATEYDTKAAVADKVLAGSATKADETILAAEAEFRGTSVAEFASLIVTKSENVKTLVGELATERVKALAAIDQVTNMTELNKVAKKLSVKKDDLSLRFELNRAHPEVDKASENTDEFSRQLNNNFETIQILAKALTNSSSSEENYNEFVQKLSAIKEQLSRTDREMA